MVWAAALALAAAAPATSGPYVLIIQTKDGYQFAHFSNAQNCRAAREVIVAQRRRASDEMNRRGFRALAPAAFWSACVPG